MLPVLRSSFFRLLSALALVPGMAMAQAASADQPHANWELANKFTTQALQRVIYSTTLTPRWIGRRLDGTI